MIKKSLIIATTVASILLASNSANAATVDTIEAPTASFGQYLYSSGTSYTGGIDWNWSHNAITESFTSAQLSISAYDVDAPNELDEIWANDSGTWVSLGTLAGNNDAWAWTTFTLGSNFFDDIATGLQLAIDIDVNAEGWAVELAKSSITTDGAALPNPNPVVPVPAAVWLFGSGLIGLAGFARRKKA